MTVNAYVTYTKMKEKYGVKTVKEVDEILARIEEELRPIITYDYSICIWNPSGARRLGKAYHFDMEEKEENALKVKSIFPEISKNFQIVYNDMKTYKKMHK